MRATELARILLELVHEHGELEVENAGAVVLQTPPGGPKSAQIASVQNVLDEAGRYWMHEQSGILRPVVEAFLNRAELSDQQCATMRAYLRHWIDAPTWQGPMVDVLRTAVDECTNRETIERWIDMAVAAGMDPL